MVKIKILIVDDQKLIRQGLKTLLELEDDFVVVGELSNGKEAVSAYERLKPDVVLMDIRMPEMDGVQATRAIVAQFENAKIIILTTFNEDEYLFEAVRAGAVGYLLKDVSSEELSKAIRVVHLGGALIQPDVAKRLLKEFSSLEKPVKSNLNLELTGREKEIVVLISRGLTNSEIADKLYLSEGTIKNYITNILAKLGAKNRASLVEIARKGGLID